MALCFFYLLMQKWIHWTIWIHLLFCIFLSDFTFGWSFLVEKNCSSIDWVHFRWYSDVILKPCKEKGELNPIRSPSVINQTQEIVLHKNTNNIQMSWKSIDLWKSNSCIHNHSNWMVKPKTMILIRSLSWHLVDWQWNAFNLVISR